MIVKDDVNQMDLDSSEDEEQFDETKNGTEGTVGDATGGTVGIDAADGFGDNIESPVRDRRISHRSNRGIPPKPFIEQIFYVHGDIVEPKDFHQAIGHQKDMWINAIQEEMDSLLQNST